MEKEGIKNLFVYVGIAIALVVTIVAFFRTIYAVIDYTLLPDSFTWWDYEYGLLNTLPASVAFLIVGFIAWFILTRASQSIEIHGMYHKLYQAVIMIVLTLSLGTVLVSGALLLESILGGDISWAYFLKLVIAFIVGVAVFFYYRYVFRDQWRQKRRQEKNWLTASSVIVVLVVIAGIVLINPLERRAVMETYDVLNQMEVLQGRAVGKFIDNGALPEKLEQGDFFYDYGHAYEDAATYERTGTSTYRLCGMFPSVPSERVTNLPNYPYDEFPVDTVGENCFDFDAKE